MKSRWVLSVGSALLATLLSEAAVQPTDVDGPVGMVRISGGGYRESRDMARQLEDVLHRLETLGGSFDRNARPLIRLVLPAKPWGMASLDVEPSSNGLPWLITVQGPLEDSLSDLNEHLARLALSMWTGRGGRPLDRGDWLAVGLAGNLFALDKARNRDLVQQLAQEERLPSLDTIVTWNRIPDGPMMEKAAAAEAVGWLIAGPNNGDLPALLERLREGRVTGDWLLALEGTRHQDPEQAWRAAVGKGDIVAGGMRSLTPALFIQFRKAIETPPAELGFDASSGLSPLSPYQLLALRGAEGVRAAALARAEAVQKLAVGTPPALSKVALTYHAFFKGLAGHSLGFLLRRRLAGADRELRQLEREAAERADLLDAYDDSVSGDVAVFPFERTALEKAVDKADVQAALPAAPARK